MLKYLLPLALVLVAVGVVLFFINPLAPLLLLLSVAIQAGILWLVLRNAQNTAYDARLDARRAQFAEDGDADAWLRQEDAEAASLARVFWSRYTKRQNALARAELLHLAGREDEARAVLAEVDEKAVTARDRENYTVLAAGAATDANTAEAADGAGKE